MFIPSTSCVHLTIGMFSSSEEVVTACALEFKSDDICCMFSNTNSCQNGERFNVSKHKMTISLQLLKISKLNSFGMCMVHSGSAIQQQAKVISDRYDQRPIDQFMSH